MKNTSNSVLVIIPAYNEAANIYRVVSEIRALHPYLNLCVVNDGSQDCTAQKARQAGAEVIDLPFNLGYGAAVQTGLQWALKAGYSACLLMDGDGQHDPACISNLLDPTLNGEADLALGSRFLLEGGKNSAPGRRLGIYIFSRLTSWLTRQPITDATSGFQAMGHDLMRYLARDNLPHDYPDADNLLRLHFAGFKIKEVPIKVRPRLHGESMHRGLGIFYYLYKMLFSIFIVITQKLQLRRERAHANPYQNPIGPTQHLDHASHHPARAKQTPG